MFSHSVSRQLSGVSGVITCLAACHKHIHDEGNMYEGDLPRPRSDARSERRSQFPRGAGNRRNGSPRPLLMREPIVESPSAVG